MDSIGDRSANWWTYLPPRGWQERRQKAPPGASRSAPASRANLSPWRASVLNLPLSIYYLFSFSCSSPSPPRSSAAILVDLSTECTKCNRSEMQPLRAERVTPPLHLRLRFFLFRNMLISRYGNGQPWIKGNNRSQFWSQIQSIQTAAASREFGRQGSLLFWREFQLGKYRPFRHGSQNRYLL
jgi:hypothetical protein